MLVASFGLPACQNAVGDGASSNPGQDPPGALPGSPGGSAGGSLGGSPGGTSIELENIQAVLPCGQATDKARTVLETYCVGCHGADSAGQGGFDTITDVAALIADGKVVPNEPDTSPLFTRVAQGVMPPSEVLKRPAEAELRTLKDWIACGAPDWKDAGATSLPFVDIDTRLRVVLDDLRDMPNPVDRKRMRYMDLSTLANAGYSDDQLQVFREAMFFLLNSLSRGRQVVAPKAIDEAKLLYRVDMRDYLWTADTWRLLEQRYPYAVVYDQDSRLFSFDEFSSEQIREQTDASMPIIQADWFLSHASRPPLYHEMLDLPSTLEELEAQLGVNIAQNVSDEQILRAGFKDAGTSRNHGVIERHELVGDRGALWVSYDFASTLGQRNVFVHPLDFQADGHQLIFNLDNGLQAYFVADAAGRRLDKAPTSLVQDPMSRDGAVENGTSCLGCHQTDGLIQKYDEVRDYMLSSGPSAREIEAALGLYSESASLADAFGEDQARYRKARAALDMRHVEERTFHALDNTHQGLMDINTAASVLGITASSLERAIDASAQAFPREVLGLRVPGGVVQRDAFDAVVGDVIAALGLGVQLEFDDDSEDPIVEDPSDENPTVEDPTVENPTLDSPSEPAAPTDTSSTSGSSPPIYWGGSGWRN
jgi:hypothetical protein